MAIKDTIVKEVKIEYEGVFSFDDFYKYLQKWMQRRNYKDGEAKYKETKKNGKRDIDILYGGQKKPDDYVKILIDVAIKVKGLEEVRKKGSKKTMHRGSLELIFVGHMTKDYEDKWGKNPVLLFLREVYDKWVIGDRLKDTEKMLKDDINKLVNECKAYLKLLKI